MEKRGYLALVLREANAFVNMHGEALKGAWPAAGGAALEAPLVAALEEQLKAALVDVDHLEDVLKHSELRDVPPESWRGAEGWQELLAGAAMAALAHDVTARARDIVEGRMPRMDNIQLC